MGDLNKNKGKIMKKQGYMGGLYCPVWVEDTKDGKKVIRNITPRKWGYLTFPFVLCYFHWRNPYYLPVEFV